MSPPPQVVTPERPSRPSALAGPSSTSTPFAYLPRMGRRLRSLAQSPYLNNGSNTYRANQLVIADGTNQCDAVYPRASHTRPGANNLDADVDADVECATTSDVSNNRSSSTRILPSSLGKSMDGYTQVRTVVDTVCFCQIILSLSLNSFWSFFLL